MRPHTIFDTCSRVGMMNISTRALYSYHWQWNILKSCVVVYSIYKNHYIQTGILSNFVVVVCRSYVNPCILLDIHSHTHTGQRIHSQLVCIFVYTWNMHRFWIHVNCVFDFNEIIHEHLVLTRLLSQLDSFPITIFTRANILREPLLIRAEFKNSSIKRSKNKMWNADA